METPREINVMNVTSLENLLYIDHHCRKVIKDFKPRVDGFICQTTNAKQLFF